MPGRPFLLIHTFKDISKLWERNHIEIRYNIPWSLRIFKKEGFLGLKLHCEKEECYETKKWTFQTKFTMKLIAPNGKFFRRTVQHEFKKPEGHGMDNFISWENMLRDYVDNDSIIIEIHADIVSSTGFFGVKYLPSLQPDSNNTFVLKHNFKNLAKFKYNESDFSDAEDHFNIPWRICIQKSEEHLGIFLHCDKEVSERRKWSIECEYEFKLITASGKYHSEQRTAVFGNRTSYSGSYTFISWIGMEKKYVNNDSVNVEAHVKIINITDEPCEMKTFALSHTFKNMSGIKEGEDYYTDNQTRFNIPWNLAIQKQNGLFGIFFQCEKELCESKWSIETEFQLKLVSPNGRSFLIGGACVFDEPKDYGWLPFIRWDDLKDKYIVNDTLIIEAQVKIPNMTGIEDEKSIEKPSGIVIPVGDQEFSLERWMEMAFDH